MFKRKCRQLKNVRVDFVSFVDRGANGEQFQIYKSADYEPGKETAEFNKEEVSFVKKLHQLFKKKETEEIMKTKEKKEDNEILKAIANLGDAVKSIDERIDTIEENISKQEDDRDDEDNDEDTGSTEEENDENSGEEEGSQNNEEIMNAINGINDVLKNVTGRLENIEKKRISSNRIEKDNKEITKNDEVSFSNIF